MNTELKLLAIDEELLGSKEMSNRSWDMRETLERSTKVRGLEGIKGEWESKWVGELPLADRDSGDENPEWTAKRILSFLAEDEGNQSVDLSYFKGHAGLGVEN